MAIPIPMAIPMTIPIPIPIPIWVAIWNRRTETKTTLPYRNRIMVPSRSGASCSVFPTTEKR